MNLLTMIRWHLDLMSWRDGAEVLFFALLFYSLTRWLKADTEKNLLPYFYGYCVLTFSAYVLHLPTMTYCLFLFCPIVIMLFIMLHQETLQRNLIALKNITLTPKPPRDWLESFLQGALKALHNNKPMLMIMEHTDALTSYLKAAFALDAQINEGIFNLIIQKELYDSSSMIWIKSNGTLCGINAHFKTSWHTQYDTPTAWIDDAMAYTSKTDCLFLQLDPAKHTCNVALEGTIHKNLTIDQTAQLIKRHIEYPLQSSLKKGIEYGIASKKERVAERAP